MTRWGRISLWGIILSAIITLTLQYLESAKAEKDAVTAKRKSDSTTTTLNTIVLAANQNLQKEDTNLKFSTKLTGSMGVALSNLKIQTRNTKTIFETIKSSLEEQKSIINEQKQSQKQTMRAYYPLEPIKIFYEVTYPMDQEYLKEYTERVQRSIATYLRKAREGRGRTDDDLRSEKGIFFIKNIDSTFLPHWNDAGERKACDTLLTDFTIFKFESPQKKSILFNSASKHLSEVIVKLTPKGPIKQTIELHADFTDRIFIKSVICENPFRTGDDLLPISSIDLVGRTLTWESENFGSKENSMISKIGLEFQYDYDDECNRYMLPDKNENFIIIKSPDVGLQEIFGNN